MITTDTPTVTIRPGRRLRALFLFDGVGNALAGPVILALIGVLHSALGLSSGVLAGVATFYVVYGALMWFAATRPRLRAGAVLGLIAANPVWAAVCLVMMGADDPTTLGAILLGAEALTVTVLAALQYAAYRRGA